MGVRKPELIRVGEAISTQPKTDPEPISLHATSSRTRAPSVSESEKTWQLSLKFVINFKYLFASLDFIGPTAFCSTICERERERQREWEREPEWIPFSAEEESLPLTQGRNMIHSAEKIVFTLSAWKIFHVETGFCTFYGIISRLSRGFSRFAQNY